MYCISYRKHTNELCALLTRTCPACALIAAFTIEPMLVQVRHGGPVQLRIVVVRIGPAQLRVAVVGLDLCSYALLVRIGHLWMLCV